MALSFSAVAQQSSDHTELEAQRLALDRIDETFKREGLSVQALFDLAQSINPVRAELLAKIAQLEPRLAQIGAALEQLGLAPSQVAPPEGAAIAAQRARLNAELGTIDAALKHARLLAARADDLAAQINDHRRSLYARQLFEPSPSVRSPFLWVEAAKALARSWGFLASSLHRPGIRWANRTPDRERLYRGLRGA
jgi:small-conductance mechanosensitive channel